MRRLIARARKRLRRRGPEDFEQTIIMIRFDPQAGRYV